MFNFRFIQGSHFKLADTISNIKLHDEFRKKVETQKMMDLLPEDIELLEKGALYFGGFDKKKRPIIIINAQKISDFSVNI